MPSLRREILINTAPEEVWDAVRDVGNVHRRLCPGVLVDTRMDGDARIVSFANGLVARELIVDVDDQARRFVWAAVGDPLRHHNASLQVFPGPDGGTRLLWIADLLPAERAGQVAALMDLGAAAMKRTLEGLRASAAAEPTAPAHRQ